MKFALLATLFSVSAMTASADMFSDFNDASNQAMDLFNNFLANPWLPEGHHTDFHHPHQHKDFENSEDEVEDTLQCEFKKLTPEKVEMRRKVLYGIWNGFVRGFYHERKAQPIDTLCFGEWVTTNVT